MNIVQLTKKKVGGDNVETFLFDSVGAAAIYFGRHANHYLRSDEYLEKTRGDEKDAFDEVLRNVGMLFASFDSTTEKDDYNVEIDGHIWTFEVRSVNTKETVLKDIREGGLT